MAAQVAMRIVMHAIDCKTHTLGLADGGAKVDIQITGANHKDVEGVRARLASFLDFEFGSGAWAGPGTGADTARDIP